MYSLILNNCVPHSQYVGSFGPYETIASLDPRSQPITSYLDLDYMSLIVAVETFLVY